MRRRVHWGPIALIALSAGCSGTREGDRVFLDREFSSLCEAFDAAAQLALGVHVTKTKQDYNALRHNVSKALAKKSGRGAIPNSKNCEDIKSLVGTNGVKTEPDAFHEVLRAFVASLDPHSRYLPPNDAEKYRESDDNREVGIGVAFDIPLRDHFRPIDGLIIEEVFEGSPAWRYLRGGQKLIAVNGVPLSGLSLGKALALIRSSAEAAEIMTEGSESAVKISLGRYRSSPIFAKVGETTNTKFHYVKLRAFTENAAERLDKFLSGLPEGEGVLLDLRNNGGGQLDEAVKIVDLFVDRGTVVTALSSEDKDIGKHGLEVRRVYRAETEGVRSSAPLVILIDPGSASASEIVAGALGASQRALVVGDRSFGKGTGQTLLPLSSRNGLGGLLLITTFRYFLSDGRTPQGGGIVPHLEAADPLLLPAVEAKRALGESVVLFESDLGDRVIGPKGNRVMLSAQGDLEKVVAEITSRKRAGAYDDLCKSEKDCGLAAAAEYLAVMSEGQSTWLGERLPATR